MENLKLLNIHKKKTVRGHALVKFIFIYVCVFIFLLTSIYFRNLNENNKLELRVSKIVTIVENQPILSKSIEIEGIEKKILEEAYIYNESWDVLSYINDSVASIKVTYWKISKIDNYKYFATQLQKNWEHYHIVARELSNNFLAEIVITIFILVVSSPILFFFLVWVSEYWLRRVYKPIEEMIESLEWFALNINHEFKTSLSEIISSLELAKITKDYEEPTEQSIASAKRLNATLDSLSLMIHFVDTDYRREKINLVKELDNSINDYATQINDKKLNIVKKYDVASPVIVLIDIAPLVLCFTNILKNSIRYSSDNEDIEISITKNSFVIKDYGVWIDKKNLKHIFERHFRESYAGQWSGIWLSLVKKITDIYNWNVSIESKKSKYTQITLTF